MLLEEPVPLLEDSNCSGSGDETSASTCSSNSELTSKEDHGLLESTMDDVLREYAPFSFYQKRLTAVCALAVLVLAPHAAILVFIGDEPDWFCDGNSAKVLGQSNVITVANKSHLNRQADCHLFHSGQCTPQYTNPIAKASAEFHWICQHATDGKYAQSLFFVGMLLGSFVSGWLSDKHGRRTAILLSYAWCIVGSIWTGISTSFWSFAASRCFTGMGTMVYIVVGFVLVSESVAPSYRGFATTVQCLTFGLGFALLAILAYFTQHSWRLLLTVLSGSEVFFGILLWLWVSESPFWLLSNDRQFDLEVLITRWAKSSSRPVRDGFLRSVSLPKDKKMTLEDGSIPTRSQSESTSLLPFLSSGLRHFSLSLLATWFAICLVYYGLGLNMNGIGSDKYTSFFIVSIVEIPALLLLIVVLKYVGRKKTMIMCITLTGACCALATGVAYFTSPASDADSSHSQSSSKTVLLVLVVSGKFVGSAFFSVLYTYTPEVMPTPIRTSGLGICTVVSRIGAIVSPFVIAWGTTWPALPYGIFTILCAISGIGLFWWPETQNRDLPETMLDLRLRLSER